MQVAIVRQRCRDTVTNGLGTRYAFDPPGLSGPPTSYALMTTERWGAERLVVEVPDDAEWCESVTGQQMLEATVPGLGRTCLDARGVVDLFPTVPGEMAASD